jgi:hypothetical protein
MAQPARPRIAYRNSHRGWFARRRLTVSVLAAGVGALVALPVPAVRASTCKPSKCIPAGTPYAAEVRIVLTTRTTAAVTNTSTVTDDCGASQPSTGTQSIDMRARVTFRQVTIPLLTKAELGKAYKRLHVRPTATSAGPATGFNGKFLASGTGPYGVNCAPKSFDTGLIDFGTHAYHGTFAQTLLSGYDDLFLDAVDQAAWFFPTPTYTDNNESTLDVQVEANNTLEEVPAEKVRPGATFVSSEGMTIGDHPEQFRALLQRPTLTIKAVYDAPSGGSGCANFAHGCRVDWTEFPKAVLTRLHIYKTQRNYAK